MTNLPAVIGQCESTWRKNKPQEYRQPYEPVPKPGTPEDKTLRWLEDRLLEICDLSSSWYKTGYGQLFKSILGQPDPLALLLWRSSPILANQAHWKKIFPEMMNRFGEHALPGLLKQIELDPVFLFDNILEVCSIPIIMCAAQILVDPEQVDKNAGRQANRQANRHVKRWLSEHAYVVTLHLFPIAAGPAGPGRDTAITALCEISKFELKNNTIIRHIAQIYSKQDPRAQQVGEQIIGYSVNHLFTRPPKWCVPQAFFKLQLTNGEFLPEKAVLTLFRILYNAGSVDLDFETSLKGYFTRKSLTAFIWDLYLGWRTSTITASDKWVHYMLGTLGDDDLARKVGLTFRMDLVKGNHDTVCINSLISTFAHINSYFSLIELGHFINNPANKQFHKTAQDELNIIVGHNTLSHKDFYNVALIYLGTNSDGCIDLDFDSLHCRAGVDQYLTPWIKDDSGAQFEKLPAWLKYVESMSAENHIPAHIRNLMHSARPDFVQRTPSSVQRWEMFKRDVQIHAPRITDWLEGFLSAQHRVSARMFLRFFLRHPLIIGLARRLIWGVYYDQQIGTAPHTIFRITDNLSFEDVWGNRVDIYDSTPSGTMGNVIGLVHPLTLTAEQQYAWDELFVKLKIKQPFPQLYRQIYTLTEEEKNSHLLFRFHGCYLEIDNIENALKLSPHLRSYLSTGWRISVEEERIWLIYSLPADGVQMNIARMFGNFSKGKKAIKFSVLNLSSFIMEKDGEGTRAQVTEIKLKYCDPVTVSELIRGPTLFLQDYGQQAVVGAAPVLDKYELDTFIRNISHLFK
jgi:hypothetical protein